MPKNVVFIPAIDLGNGRADSYRYAIDSWKYWCDKNDCELLVWDTLIYPVEQWKITWQRYHMFDLLAGSEIDFHKVLMVDADIIVHPACPNFFREVSSLDYTGVINDGDYEWVNRSIVEFGDQLFDGRRIPVDTYINGGFQIVGERHRKFFDAMLEYYGKNKQAISEAISACKTATDQTILNFRLHESHQTLGYLPIKYNLQDLFRKNLLHIPGYSWWKDSLENLYSSGWCYHLNAIPPNQSGRDSAYWMRRVYEELYGV